MASYNYYGQNYANPYPYQPVYQSPMIQPQQMQNVPQVQSTQNYSPVISQSGIIWISGLQEAQMYPIAPNNAVALWQKDGKTIYLKSADATGRPSLVIYDLVERKETASESSSEQNEKVSIYATKDDLEVVVGAIKSISGDIETMKSDLYGVAGKRKSAKKADPEMEE